MIFWIVFLYLKFPPARNASQREAGGEEISNEQLATPKRKTLYLRQRNPLRENDLGMVKDFPIL